MLWGEYYDPDTKLNVKGRLDFYCRATHRNMFMNMDMSFSATKDSYKSNRQFRDKFESERLNIIKGKGGA